MPVILVVDDEPLQRGILKTILDAEGFETYTADSGVSALKLVKTIEPDAILTDLRMDGMDGIELMESIPDSHLRPSIIIMTAHGSITSAVDAVRKGAFDYLTKPLDKDNLLLTINRAVERMSLIRENLQLHNELYGKFKIEGIIGKSERMSHTVNVLKKIAPTTATVLIRGDSGTGKELIARAIHYNSPRKTKPFTALNCAAIPENLFESELFGHEAGSFTGATGRRIGLFEASQNGTLFLDEIGDLPLQTQSKLLRVLQDKEIRRVGGKDAIKVDVRIISATNKDLEIELSKGTFREDLYYRLKVVSIDLPPLRERKEDIPLLVEYFIKKYNREFGKRVKGISPTALKALAEFAWPGNIRQLESVIEKAILMNDSGVIDTEDFSGELRTTPQLLTNAFKLPDEGVDFEQMERDLINQAMNRAAGVASKAAKLLGMSYKTFMYRLEKHNLGATISKRTTGGE